MASLNFVTSWINFLGTRSSESLRDLISFDVPIFVEFLHFWIQLMKVSNLKYFLDFSQNEVLMSSEIIVNG